MRRPNRFYSEALVIYKKVLGTEHPHAFMAMKNCVSLLQMIRRIQKEDSPCISAGESQPRGN